MNQQFLPESMEVTRLVEEALASLLFNLFPISEEAKLAKVSPKVELCLLLGGACKQRIPTLCKTDFFLSQRFPNKIFREMH